MISTIIDSNFNISSRITGNNTFLKSLFDTFFNGGNKVGWNGSAFDSVDEFITFTSFFWFNMNFTVTILTVTARLMNVFTFTIGWSRNSFTIGNLRSTGFNVYIEFSFLTIDNDFQIKFTHTGDNCLTSFLIVSDSKSRIFDSQTI